MRNRRSYESSTKKSIMNVKSSSGNISKKTKLDYLKIRNNSFIMFWKRLSLLKICFRTLLSRYNFSKTDILFKIEINHFSSNSSLFME